MTEQAIPYQMPPPTTASIAPPVPMGTPAPATDGFGNSVLSLLTNTYTKYVLIAVILVLISYYLYVNWDSGFSTNKDKTFTLFFAPWCKWCSEVKPIIEDIKKDLEDVKSFSIHFTDCTTSENEEHCKDIEGYPTMKFFDGEKTIDYDEGRTKEEISKWIKSKLKLE